MEFFESQMSYRKAFAAKQKHVGERFMYASKIIVALNPVLWIFKVKYLKNSKIKFSLYRQTSQGKF